MAKRKRLGDILIESGEITPEQLKHALSIQKKTKQKLGEVFISEKILTESEILQVLEFQLGVPFLDLNSFQPDKKVVNLISESVARKHNIIPVEIKFNKILLAMSDPLDILAIDDVKIITGFDVQIAIASKNDIQNAINRYYDESEEAEKAVKEFSEELASQEQESSIEIDDGNVANAPMVRLVNSIIIQAAKMKASDIHIEPFDKVVRIRFRIDGDLKEIMAPSKATHLPLVTRIKIMSKLDIAERRIPQDGRVETVIDGNAIDLRVSILPTVYGEKVVIRLLYRNSIMLTKEQLGFSQYNLQLFDKIIKSPEGIILVTGPTGSGKSTTLYTVLRELNDIKKNIITVEDPVEYRLGGVNQVQVNVKAGMTFASGLRSILRQDPDIIMVGEIRDAETAEIAVRAAITGHLVLSTLHTNDTASTVARLEDMGIEPYMVSTSVVGIMAQRLVKRLCKKCKQDRETTIEEMKLLGINKPATISHAIGCNQCNNTGYSGRIAIHEILVIDNEIKGMISTNKNSDMIKEAAKRKGMKTLNDSAKNLVLNQITTIEEMLRVTYSVQ